ncbi:MAG: hypothetical protein HRU18_00905 [Pseudoalteromonas sp.]|uniref:hypothetical protein n=1 Tax=Pseudoalteromonas sp. TaxID=53249 RepID=UPI001D8A6CD6|nr:hypothetical protein [Pseudoalteromonas sp.]NRA76739.1 hypothetical protein [Pseudoalteromonas sp.]
MTSRFILPFADVGSGIKPSSGAKLFFFQTNGTTPKDTFSDQLSTPTPNTNPVIADGNGVFGNIYISGQYKVDLQDKNGSQIFGGAEVSELAVGNFTDDLINDLSQAYEVKTVDELRLLSGMPDDKVIEWTDYYSDFKGGGNKGTVKSGAHTDDGGSIFTLADGKYVLADIDEEGISYSQFGAKGDFDPGTGIGFDSRLAIQATINYRRLNGGGKIIENSGNFYLGLGYNQYNHQVSLGEQDATATSLVDLHIDTSGATFFQGAEGKCFVFARAERCSWKGANIRCFAGGPLGVGRENDAGILINKNCEHIDIYNHYITNSFGDCVTVSPDVTVAGGGLGSTCRDITIRDGVLKERFGDNVPSFLGGTQSRQGIAIIEGFNVKVYGNTIYGGIVLEPNLNDQYLANISINDNKLMSGKVINQSVIGSDYWHDEPLSLTTGSIIETTINLTGIPGAPLIFGNTVKDNTIENGKIGFARVYVWDEISDNTFITGSILISSDTAIGPAVGAVITNNTCKTPFQEGGFILINGQLSDSNIADNTLTSTSTLDICVKIGTAIVGPDFVGNTSFSNNIATKGVSYSGVFDATSVVQSNKKILNADYTPLVSVGITVINTIIDWEPNGGNNWFVTQPSGSILNIIRIDNAPEAGYVLRIIAEASGGGTLTFTHSVEMRMIGGVDLVLGAFGSVTLMYFGSNSWIQIT